MLLQFHYGWIIIIANHPNHNIFEFLFPAKVELICQYQLKNRTNIYDFPSLITRVMGAVLVVCTVAQQNKGPGLNSKVCRKGVCLFSLCQSGCSSFTHSSQQYNC